MSSNSTSRRVVFEAQDSLAAVAPPLSESLEQLNAAMIRSMDATLGAALSDIQAGAKAACFSAMSPLSTARIQAWAKAACFSAMSPLSTARIQAWAKAACFSAMSPLSTARILPYRERADVPVLALPPSNQPSPRRRGRPPGTEIVLRAKEIEEVHRSRARGLRRRPKRTEVAAELGVGDSTLYRRLRDMGLLWPPPWSD